VVIAGLTAGVIDLSALATAAVVITIVPGRRAKCWLHPG